MLFFLGLDSEFALLETVLTAVYDSVPRLRNHKERKQGFIILLYVKLQVVPRMPKS
jgi:hypothetical protein